MNQLPNQSLLGLSDVALERRNPLGRQLGQTIHPSIGETMIKSPFRSVT